MIIITRKKIMSGILWRPLILLACLLYSINGKAQVTKERIACIGNSITFGARLTHPETESYPAVLSALLTEKGYLNYEIKNFGIGGATMLRFGSPNLWRMLDSLKSFPPDIVVIKAGTNETVGAPRLNWEHISEFEKDYSDYIAAIRKINPDCRIIICSPLDMVLETKDLTKERKDDLSGRRPRIWELRQRIKKIAATEHVFFLDLTKPFKGKPDLMTTTDGVHPNLDGYHYLATLVFKCMRKKKIIVQ
jgi:acyl-CoA thioesterase I